MQKLCILSNIMPYYAHPSEELLILTARVVLIKCEYRR